MIEVRKYGATVQISDEARREGEQTAAALKRYMTATPGERAEWARQAAEARAAERAAAPAVELTLDTLLTKLGWSRTYAEHVVQPYCDCDDTRAGWEMCQHARDLGLETWQ